TSGRNAIPAYEIGAAIVRLQILPSHIRTGPFRSLAAAPNLFPIESFMDELAFRRFEDPIAFRRRHIADARLRQVLQTVCDRSGWNSRIAIPQHGFGTACAIYNGTRVAVVIEVAMGAEHDARVVRVWCAVDAGRIVHPDGARNQVEGAMQQSASWTLLEALHVEGGKVLAACWADYPIARIDDAPSHIDVVFIGGPSTPSSGIGEVGTVPVAAAVANAIFDATGSRVRDLPITGEKIRAAGRSR